MRKTHKPLGWQPKLTKTDRYRPKAFQGNGLQKMKSNDTVKPGLRGFIYFPSLSGSFFMIRTYMSSGYLIPKNFNMLEDSDAKKSVIHLQPFSLSA
jgi:hypothetical protein